MRTPRPQDPKTDRLIGSADDCNFAFSPCPNDTFAFHLIVHGLVPNPRRRISTTSEALNISPPVPTQR